MEGEKLERVYQKIKSGKASAAAVHSIGAGTSGTTPSKAVTQKPFLLATFQNRFPNFTNEGFQIGKRLYPAVTAVLNTLIKILLYIIPGMGHFMEDQCKSDRHVIAVEGLHVCL